MSCAKISPSIGFAGLLIELVPVIVCSQGEPVDRSPFEKASIQQAVHQYCSGSVICKVESIPGKFN